MFWYRGPTNPAPLVTIDILHPGDETGEGLVRHCTFPVPRFSAPAGRQVVEWVTQVKPTSRGNDAIGSPWSRAEGHIFLDDSAMAETRGASSRATRRSTRGCAASVEKWVHEKISSDTTHSSPRSTPAPVHRDRKAKSSGSRNRAASPCSTPMRSHRRRSRSAPRHWVNPARAGGRDAVKPAWRARGLPRPAYPVRCTRGGNLGIHVAVARAPAGVAIVAEMGGVREPATGRGAHHGAEARGFRGPRDRRLRARLRRARRPRVPGLLHRLALTGGARAAGRGGSPVTVGDVDVEPGDWSSPTSTVWSSSPAPRSTTCSPRAGRADREAALFEALRAGSTTVEELGLDAGLIEAPDRSVRGVVDRARARTATAKQKQWIGAWSQTGRRLCTASGGMWTRSPCAISRISSPMVMRPRPAVT